VEATHIKLLEGESLAEPIPLVNAWGQFVAGADLVQIYSVLIYEGPDVVREIIEGLADKVTASGCATLTEAVAKARIISSGST